MGAFCQPLKRNEADFDAVILDEEEGAVFLQMTIGDRHPVKGRNMQHVMQELEVSEGQIWFIVPSDSAARFPAQSVGYKCEEGKPNVRQSVAYVPPHGSLAYKANSARVPTSVRDKEKLKREAVSGRRRSGQRRLTRRGGTILAR